MLPDGWRQSAVRAIAPGVTSGSRGWAAYYADAGNPFYRITNLRRTSIRPDLTDLKYVQLPANSSEGTRTRLRSGDILVSITADLGIIGYIDEEPPIASYVSQHIARIRIADAQVEPAFVAYQLASDRHRKIVQLLNDAGAKAGLNLPTIESIPLYLPPLKEQRRIAAVLDAWESAIDSAERLRAAKRERQNWMINMVLAGPIRLAGFEREWRRMRLAQALHEHGSVSTGAESVYSVSVSRGLVDQIEHLGRSFAAASTLHYNRVKPGDIVYTKSPTGSFPLGIIKQSKVEHDVIVSPLYGVFTPKSRALGIMLDAYFSSPANALRYLTPLVQKGAKNTIAVTNSQFLQGYLSLPTDELEIEALATLVDEVQGDIALANDMTSLLRRQKQALMQKLLTGGWRVPVHGDSLVPGGPIADRLAEAAE